MRSIFLSGFAIGVGGDDHSARRVLTAPYGPFECVALSLWIMFSYFEWKVVLRIVGEGRKGACPAVQSGPA